MAVLNIFNNPLRINAIDNGINNQWNNGTLGNYWGDYEGKDADPNEITLKIAKSTTNGDILLFQPGQMEINRSIEYLNQHLPSNMIALPFYANMTQEKKEFIQDLNEENIKKLRIPKNINYADNYDEERLRPG